MVTLHRCIHNMQSCAWLYHDLLHTGCERCYSLDGNWKITFPHCMFPVIAGVPGISALNIPNVNPNQLKAGTAFCVRHLEVATSLKYPTDIRAFLKFCGVHCNQESECETDHEQLDEVDSYLLHRCVKVSTNIEDLPQFSTDQHHFQLQCSTLKVQLLQITSDHQCLMAAALHCAAVMLSKRCPTV